MHEGRTARIRTIAIANQKGGVGKTTLTILLAAAHADAGRRVLLVDLDPQANATSATLDPAEGGSLADVLLDGRLRLADVVRPSVWGFDIAPSEVALAAKEQRRRLADEHDLDTAIGELAGYDLVLVDCPPSLGALTVNALTAVDAVLIVAEAGGFAIDGVAQLLDTIGVVRRHYNLRLRVAGIGINLHDHTLETRRHLATARSTFGSALLEPLVPRRVVIREAIATRTRLTDLPTDRDGPSLASTIRDLAEEVARRVR